MHWINTLLHEYGQNLGMNNLLINDQEAAGLLFENGNELIFEIHNEQLVVSLLHQSLGYELLKELQTALQHCHYERGSVIQVQPGLFGENTLALSVYVEREDATTTHLDTIILHLRDMIKQVFG